MAMYFSSKERSSLRDYVNSIVDLNEGKAKLFDKYLIVWKNKIPDQPRCLEIKLEWEIYKKTIISYFNPHNVIKYCSSRHEKCHILVFKEVYQLIGTEAMNIILNYSSIYFEVRENTWLTVLTSPSLNDLSIPNESVIGKRKPILYSFVRSSMWPKYSALQKHGCVSQLLQAVLSQRIDDKFQAYNYNLKQHMLPLEPELQKMILRHTKLNYKAAFKNHLHRRKWSNCPMPLTALMHTVDFFVRKVCPLSLFGNLNNKKKFMCLVKYIISKGEVNMNDKIVSAHMKNIDISKVNWLYKAPDDKLKLYLFQKVIFLGVHINLYGFEYSYYILLIQKGKRNKKHWLT